MVLFPRFWRGLPYPPEYLAEVYREIDMVEDPSLYKAHDMPVTLPQALSAPTPRQNPPASVDKFYRPSEPILVRSPFGLAAKGAKGYEDKLVKGLIKQQFQDKTDIDYDVIDFVQHVWKFKPEDIPYSSYELDRANCHSYAKLEYERIDGISYQEITGERACCSAFENIIRGVCHELTPAIPSDEREFPLVFSFLHDRTPKGDYGKFKPDFGYAPAVEVNEHTWAHWGAYGELKKKRVTPNIGPTTRIVVTKTMIERLVKEWELRQRPDKRKDTDSSSSASTSNHATLSPAASPTTQSRKRKRKAKAPAEPRVSKRTKTSHGTRRVVDLTGNEIQSAKYANELLSHGIRNYATGFLVEETSMSLWYVDRMGLVKSRSFDIFRNPQLFLLVIAALHFANRAQLGMNPLIEFPPGVFQSYDRAVLRLPRAVDHAKEPVEELTFGLRITKAKPLVVAYGALGRGTTIIPVKAQGRARELFGSENLVAKMSWQPINREDTEDQLIRVIRRKLGKRKKTRRYLKHIVDLKCSLDLTDAELTLPRASMMLPEAYEPRLFRVLILREYLPLEYVRGLDDFQRIFIDAVKAHHKVYEIAGVLHCDISAGNVVFYRDDVGHAIGVLADWDLAAYKLNSDDVEKWMRLVEAKGIERASESSTLQEDKDSGAAPPDGDSSPLNNHGKRVPRYRTGTGPFMALDLLKSIPIFHGYRHDLESFYYLLCYFCATFNPPKPSESKGTFRFLAGWENGNLSAVANAKMAFLFDEKDDPEDKLNTFDSLFKDTHEVYRPMVINWIQPLSSLFMTVPKVCTDIAFTIALIRAARKAGDVRKERQLTKKLKRRCEEADEYFTYDKFMEVLLL
ncbi:unnamed protein product [Somion occarium]|uniref:Fungal-type protein kinase domain-containing protein n=1 Tax=Somion occarium TaxID=3059160 RepID=A0ABP1CUV2_9APHY